MLNLNNEESYQYSENFEGYYMKKLFTVIVAEVLLLSLTYRYIKQLKEKLHYIRNKLVSKNKLFNTTERWVRNLVESKDISESLKKNGYSKIAIYGMGKLGTSLLLELANSDVSVLYGIDRNGRGIYCSIPVYAVDEVKDIHEIVDVIVVTTVDCFDRVRHDLEDKVSRPIISLEQLLV